MSLLSFKVLKATNFWNAVSSSTSANLIVQVSLKVLNLWCSITKYFLSEGKGNLIHISSIQGIRAPKFDHYIGTEMSSPIEYAAIKAGIIAITKWLAKYYKNNGMRINCISPGGIKDNQDEIFLRNYRKSCNNKGILDSEDISGLALFLISDDSLFINGQNLIIDDGWSL